MTGILASRLAPSRPVLFRWALAIFLLTTPLLATPSAWTQEASTSRPINLVLATAAGGIADAVARIVQPAVAKRLDQTVVVVNRPGASGEIGVLSVARAPADGHTLLLNLEMHVINQVTTKNPHYDVLRDFEPISLLARLPNMIAIPSALKARTVAEFVALAKDSPAKFNYGTPGRATSVFLLSEEFKVLAGIEMAWIPYNGGPQVTRALMANEIQFAILSLPPFRSAVQSGAIVPIAVTGDTRLPDAPSVPTMKEAGFPNFVSYSWIGMFAPAGTPAATVARLHDAFAAAIADPDVRDKLIALGFEPVGSTPEALGEVVKKDYVHWTNFIQKNHIKFE